MLIHGKVGPRFNYFPECFILKLDPPVEDKKYAVVNYESKGKAKIENWKEGESFSMEVEYSVGPDAILIKEIL